MKELVNSFGGWPVADKRWSSNTNISMEELLGQLKHELNEGILFEVWVGPDDKNSSLHVIQVCIPFAYRILCIWHCTDNNSEFTILKKKKNNNQLSFCEKCFC